MYKYKIFYETHDHQLLKTQAIKRENPKMIVFFTKLKAIQTPGLNLIFTWV